MPGSREDDFKKIYVFHLNGHAPCTWTPTPGVLKFNILIDPSLVIITINLVCMDHVPEGRRRILKKYINFTLFTPQITSP